MATGFSTRAIHAGQEHDQTSGAIVPPIYQTSTYGQHEVGGTPTYCYSRTGNPSRDALERNIAALENAAHALCFSSGMSAINNVLNLLSAGDHVIACNDLYGGAYRIFTKLYAKLGIEFTFVDATEAANITEAIRPNTRIVWLETPSNPLMNIIDIAAVSERAASVGAQVAVDNTFASPFLQQPLDLGATLVMHSTTKYIGGHSDVVGGAICTNDDWWNDSLRFIVKSAGAAPGPMDCFLLLRGTKTLHVRMERHCSNAEAVAHFLNDHPLVDRVRFPGLPNHPGHDIARRQMSGFGGMLSFTLKGDRMADAVTVLSNTSVFSLAESLGGVESLIEHPASMTHASVPVEERRRIGLDETLIRLSVGIEDVEDLLADLDHALAQVTG